MLAGSATATGPHRKLNEDSLLAQAPVFVVADGMGGHDAGEVASAVVVSVLARLTESLVAQVEAVQRCIVEARGEIEAITTREGRDAGTTISGAIIVEQDGLPYWLVVNLGDSRTYRLSGGQLEQMTVDHSEVQELIDSGQLNATDARRHPRRNVVTRALGGGGVFAPDYWLIPMGESDRLLVCSDGLTSELSDASIDQLLRSNPDPQATADALVAAALEAGGHDNVSVIVVDVWDVLGAEPDTDSTQTVPEFDDDITNPSNPAATEGAES